MDGGAALRRPRGPRARAASSPTCRTRRCAPARPRSRTSTRCSASTPSTRRSPTPRKTEALLRDTLGFQDRGDDRWEARGDQRGGLIRLEAAAGRGFGGAGTIHHIAWATTLDEHTAWREHVAAAGYSITEVIDRFYFRSVYFREPGGILFELASIGPGFTSDEPLEALGERLSLPPDFEKLRAQVEPLLTPLPDVRQWRPAPVG